MRKAFADSVDTHTDYARVWLDWSTAIREEIWPHYLEFQENIVAIIANTIRRWRLERGITDDDAEDDARLIVGSAHMIAQLKFTRCPPEKSITSCALLSDQLSAPPLKGLLFRDELFSLMPSHPACYVISHGQQFIMRIRVH